MKRVQFQHLKHLPFLNFEIFTTRACEISFIKFVHIGVLKISRKIAGCIWKLIRFVSDQQVITSTESRSVRFETTYSFIFQRFD